MTLDSRRFWVQVRRDPSGCWMWSGSTNPNGYGHVTLHGVRGAHRIAWALMNGPIPAGRVVMHGCDNPPCVNPDHLSLGSQMDNIHDAIAKGRRRGNPDVYRGNQ